MTIVKKARRISFFLSRLIDSIFLVSLFLLHSSSLYSAFQDPYWSARVASLGGAFTAISNDPTAIFYNSAATVGIKNKQMNFGYAKLFVGVDNVNFSLSQFAYLHPLSPIVSMGIGWGSFNSSDLYREDTVLVSYARSFKGSLKNFSGEFSAGVSVRYLTRRFILDERTTQDPVFRYGSGNHNAAFDLHLYSIPDPDLLPGFSLGVSIKSLNQPDIGFNETERLPREITGGLLYQWKNFSFPLDVTHRLEKIQLRVGSELSLANERIKIRLGTGTFQFGGGFGYSHALSQRFSLLFDYAFLESLKLSEIAVSHRATMGLKF